MTINPHPSYPVDEGQTLYENVYEMLQPSLTAYGSEMALDVLVNLMGVLTFVYGVDPNRVSNNVQTVWQHTRDKLTTKAPKA